MWRGFAVEDVAFELSKFNLQGLDYAVAWLIDFIYAPQSHALVNRTVKGTVMSAWIEFSLCYIMEILSYPMERSKWWISCCAVQRTLTTKKQVLKTCFLRLLKDARAVAVYGKGQELGFTKRAPATSPYCCKDTCALSWCCYPFTRNGVSWADAYPSL